MRHLIRARGGGTWSGVEGEPGALARLVEAADSARVAEQPIGAAHADLWLKGDHLPGSARWRHSLRRLCGLGAPRVREFHCLQWLRARLFRCPRPLAAAVYVRSGVTRYQVLALQRLEHVVALDDAWPRASPDERGAWIDELAREVARMHALHFVHRDLFVRNVLVDRSAPPERGDPRRLLLCDAWRSGAALPRRGVAHDLACLMLDGAELLSSDEQRRFARVYASEREAQGSPIELARLLEAASRARARLIDRLQRQPERLRDRPAPRSAWDWRVLSS
jgi:hypothetical protein